MITNIDTIPSIEYNSLKSELTELYRIRCDFQVTYAKIKIAKEQGRDAGILMNLARDHYKDINLQIIRRELRLKTVVDLMDLAEQFETTFARGH